MNLREFIGHLLVNLRESVIEHLFLHGPVAAASWTHFAKIFGVLVFNARGISSQFILWACSKSKVTRSHIRFLVPMLVLWFLWKARNTSRFQGVAFSSDQVILLVENFLDQMGTSGVFLKSSFSGDNDCRWSRFAKAKPRVRRVVAIFMV